MLEGSESALRASAHRVISRPCRCWSRAESSPTKLYLFRTAVSASPTPLSPAGGGTSSLFDTPSAPTPRTQALNPLFSLLSTDLDYFPPRASLVLQRGSTTPRT